jgi:hypothetical protein
MPSLLSGDHVVNLLDVTMPGIALAIETLQHQKAKRQPDPASSPVADAPQQKALQAQKA